jgi:methionine synthase II (cobalamin-independent)
MRLPILATNLIGSYPLADSASNFRRAIDDQVEIGLDFVSYPQLADMNLMFLEPLEDDNTLRREGDRFMVSPDFDPRVGKEIRRWAEDAREILRRKGLFRLKSCVTGPFTLASSLRMEGAPAKPFPRGYVEMLSEEPWILEKLTTYVRRICARYSAVSSMVSVDEPYLSVLVGRRNSLFELAMSRSQARDLVIETLERTLAGVSTIPASHVCGGISRQLAEMLLELDVSVISHEFSATTDNLDSYSQRDLESSTKVLSVGVVATSPTEEKEGVESQAGVVRRMEEAIHRYGVGNVIFSPDCGFRPLGELLGEENGYGLALEKIRRMVGARKDLAIALGLETEEKHPGVEV